MGIKWILLKVNWISIEKKWSNICIQIELRGIYQDDWHEI